MLATLTLNPSLDEWVRLPRLRVGALNRAAQFERYPGGKGINVSRVLHELGEPTVAFAPAGGADGLILCSLMRRLGVAHEFVGIPGSTRNNYKLVTEHPRAFTEVNTSGPPLSASALQRLLRRLWAHRPRPRCLVLCGALPPGPAASTYARLIRQARRRGLPCVLDASGAALRAGLPAGPLLAKPNRAEAEELLGRPVRSAVQAITAAQTLAALGPQVVILSLGADGAVMALRRPQQVWQARAPRVRVQSAVGAGDALVGGWVAGWSRGWAMPEAFRLGVACGTAAVMTTGTALCRRRDVQRLLPRVAVRRVR
ncbi:MAG: 1-phosphofructokinase family hexose kinase [Candidatus Omnitrophica bacterium]|nr:1-phosphofructokinase family hexose kinase [Candidatus Omnitrophota bacterium]